MQNGTRKVEIERGAKLDASRPKEMLLGDNGQRVSAPVHLAEQIAKKRGLKPKINYGRPTERWVVRNGELVRVI